MAWSADYGPVKTDSSIAMIVGFLTVDVDEYRAESSVVVAARFCVRNDNAALP